MLRTYYYPKQGEMDGKTHAENLALGKIVSAAVRAFYKPDGEGWPACVYVSINGVSIADSPENRALILDDGKRIVIDEEADEGGDAKEYPWRP